MTNQSNVLILEDVDALRQSYLAQMSGDGLAATATSTAAEARRALDSTQFDVVLLDVNLRDGSGLDILRDLKSAGVDSEVIVVTAEGSINLAVEAMRLGASDFVVKPASAERLRLSIQGALERRRSSNTRSRSIMTASQDRSCGFVGNSKVIESVYRTVESAARSKATVVITGESGTGKELCAEAIHALSGRAEKPFVALNCAAIPRELIESELFGHVKGAFTGASADRAGAALTADSGTLFLDEIGEMDAGLQAKLLRFLQTGMVQRVGSDRPQPVDVRIVCATNRNLRREVAAGRFREDLFYRLNVISIEMPPLRQRGGDVILLAREFLSRYAAEDGKSLAGFAPDVEAKLTAYAWPGNVRELQNLIRNIVVLNNGDTVTVDMLPKDFGSDGAAHDALATDGHAADDVVPLDRVIDRAIEAAIRKYSGSIPKAAAALGVSPSTIYRRIQSRPEKLDG